MAGFQSITVPALMRLVGTPQAPIIIDLRIDEDFEANPTLIPGAQRHSHQDVAGLVAGLDGTPTVALCHAGKKISQGVAAQLRAIGQQCEVLEGGMEAWRAAGCPVVPFAQLPRPVDGTTLWVTRHRPKVDRIACPWLIRRFIDRKARILFVPPGDVSAVADRFGATAFDTAEAPYTHVGDKCSFDALITAFGLSHPALDRLADIVRAADTDQLSNDPQAAGLLALSIGLSRMHKDDNAQLEAALPLYDALYRWARDGQDETHDSSGATTS